MTSVRLLMADRSATVRMVLRRVLGEFEAITVVGETDDGREAVELVRNLKPDGLVTDLDLVGVGGLQLIQRVAEARRIPIFALIPAIRSDNTRIAFAAHELGVVGVHAKPDLPGGWADLGRVLGQSIVEVCGKTGSIQSVTANADDVTVESRGLRYAAIGTSTGGPGALCELLRALEPGAGIGIAVVQHIAAGFETALAEWLAVESGLDVGVARDGEILGPGQVRIAPAGGHMLLSPDGRLHLDPRSPAVNGHTPAVDTLFRSLLQHPPQTVAAIQLTGMGSDGSQGLLELRRAQVLTLAQDEASCAVFGMPRAAIKLGAATLTLAPAQIGRLLARSTGAR